MKNFLAMSSAVAALACAVMTSQSSTRLATQNVTARTISTSATLVQLQAAPPVQATKPGLSSPEKSVRAFIAALNANRFEEAALCVDGALPKADFAPLRDMVSQAKTNISLSMLSSSIEGDKASLKVGVTVKNGTRRQSRTENVSMVRRGARWLLVPSNPQAIDASANFLASCAAVIRSPQIIADAMSQARESARRSSCSSNLKQMALAAMMLMQDNAEKMAVTPQNFKTKLFPYSRTMQIFRCPSIHSGESYSFNGNLANHSLSEIVNPHQTVMFYEGRNGKLDFRHLGLCNIAFVDGHVKSVTPLQAKALRWKP